MRGLATALPRCVRGCPYLTAGVGGSRAHSVCRNSPAVAPPPPVRERGGDARPGSGRRGGRLDLHRHGPHEAGEFPRDRRAGHRRLLAAPREGSVSGAEPGLRLPGDLLDPGRNTFELLELRLASMRGGNRWVQALSTSSCRIRGLPILVIDLPTHNRPAARPAPPARARDSPSACRGPAEPADVADLDHEADRRHQIDAAQGLQRIDDRRQVPGRQELGSRAVEAAQPLLRDAHRLDISGARSGRQGARRSCCCSHRRYRAPPVRAARKIRLWHAAERHSPAGCAPGPSRPSRRGTARGSAIDLMDRIRHPDRGQLARPQKAGEHRRVARLVFTDRRPAGNQRRRHHGAAVPQIGDQPMRPYPVGPAS